MIKAADHDIVKHGLFNWNMMSLPDEPVHPQEVRIKHSLRKPLSWQYKLQRQRLIERLFEQSNPPKSEIGFIEDLVESCLVDLFESREIVYPSDVVAALDLDYDLVDKIFAKFFRQGKLKE